MFASKIARLQKLLSSEINRAQRFQYCIGVLELEIPEKKADGAHHLLPGTTLDVEHISSKFRAYDHVERTDALRYTVMLPSLNSLDEVKIVRKRIKEIAAGENWGAVNIGIAVYPFDGETAEEILLKARDKLQPE